VDELTQVLSLSLFCFKNQTLKLNLLPLPYAGYPLVFDRGPQHGILIAIEPGPHSQKGVFGVNKQLA
jgi:hypothetical protein